VLNTQAFRDVLTETLKKAPLEHVPLERVSSFGVGGPADLFFEAGEEDDLVRAAALASREGFPYYVIGGGSNLLFDDSGYRGLIIRNRIEGVDVLPNRLAARSGTALSALVREALGHGLRGLEFLAGIPGTVGGALFGNAGAFGRSLGEAFEEAALLESGGERLTVGRADLTFGYRRSSLQEKHALILGATFSVTPGDPRVSGPAPGQAPSLRDAVRRKLLQESRRPGWRQGAGRPAARGGRGQGHVHRRGRRL
jgi:UDP-N-acetylmuramate dehydrogenase